MARFFVFPLLLAALLLPHAAAAEEPAGGFYAECSPIGNVADTLGALLAPMVQQMPELADEPAMAALLGLASQDQMATAGFDPEGRLRASLIGMDGDFSLAAEIPFAGDDVAAEAFLTQLAPAGLSRTAAGTWPIQLEKRALEASLADGLLVLRTAGAEVESATPEELPADWRTDGCGLALTIDPSGDAPAALRGLSGLTAFLPMPDADAPEATFRVRMNAPEGVPAYFGQLPEEVAMGSSAEPPILVGTFGVPLLEVLDAKPLSEIIQLPVLNVEALRDAIEIDPGATVALLNSPATVAQTGEPLGFVVALRARTLKGQLLKPPHLARALKEVVKADPTWTLNRISGRAHELTRDSETYVFHLGKETLYVGTDASMVASSGLGEGVPWAHAAHATTAGAWAITISTPDLMGVVPMGESPTQWPAVLRLRVADEMLEAELSLIGPGAVQFALGAASAVLVPNFIEMQRRAKRAELPSNVDGIRTAMKAYHAEFGTFPTAPIAPRALDQLDGDAVEWVSTPEWDALGWRADGTVRGAYWVEVSDDGESFKVYGTADVDGDGIPCMFQGTRSDPATMLTPPGVY